MNNHQEHQQQHAAFTGTRTQTLVGDRQFIASMIPHHSGAILMCREATLSDPELVKLCQNISQSQRDGINQMEAIAARLGGKAASTPLVQISSFWWSIQWGGAATVAAGVRYKLLPHAELDWRFVIVLQRMPYRADDACGLVCVGM
jgi:hypothetical protein